MEKEVKMTNETTREDLGKKEDSEKGLFKQQSDEVDKGNLGKANIEGRVSVISRPTGQKHLFGIPVDEQIFKLSTGPRGGSGRSIYEKDPQVWHEVVTTAKATHCARKDRKETND